MIRRILYITTAVFLAKIRHELFPVFLLYSSTFSLICTYLHIESPIRGKRSPELFPLHDRTNQMAGNFSLHHLLLKLLANILVLLFWSGSIQSSNEPDVEGTHGFRFDKNFSTSQSESVSNLYAYLLS